MSQKIQNVIQYFESLFNNKSVYLWGANSEIITKDLCNNLLKTYGSSTYNKIYYDNKLKEGQGRIGADCSGAMFPMSGFDTTARSYYSKCNIKGNISDIPRNKPCLVFKGFTTSAINHIGFYCGNGYVVEMKSSKDNCVKDVLDNKGWKWYGIPTWIDYIESSDIVNPSKTKCIDVSSYQGNINWNLVKSSGIDNVILKVIQKSLLPDNKFEEYYSGCRNSNINVIGVYNYSYATTVAKAKIDAQKVISVLNGRKTKIWLDVEDKCQQNIGSLLKDIINVYQEVIENAGYQFGVYTGLSFYNTYIKPYIGQIKCKDWWIARYYNSYNKMDVTINPNEQYKPNIGYNIYGWQYTSSGQVPGINGNVDLNILYSLSETPNKPLPVIPSNPSYSETAVSFLGKITTQTSNLTIRKEPNTKSTNIGLYKKNSIVQIIAKTSNGWYRTKDGYISGDYIQGAVATITNCTALNMRSEPNPSLNNVVKTLKKENEIALLSESNGWYKSKTDDGIVGWVSGKYIKIK